MGGGPRLVCVCVCVCLCVRMRACMCVLKSGCPESDLHILSYSVTDSVHLKSVNYFLPTVTVLHFLA